MENILNISSKINPENVISGLVEIISPENIDYIYTEEFKRRRSDNRYLLSFKSRDKIPCENTANMLCDWILNEYEKTFMTSILRERFEVLSKEESADIIDIAEKSNIIFKKIYSSKIIVKNLSKYLNFNNHISISGFLRFRAAEYRRALEKLLANAIDEFCIEKEYQEFVKSLRMYIADCSPLINLLHIKANPDGTFSLFDFKKTEILFSVDATDSIENFFTEEDKLMSILIKTAPKRIIWHNNCKSENLNLINTINEIFDNRFTRCTGCELCAKQTQH